MRTGTRLASALAVVTAAGALATVPALAAPAPRQRATTTVPTTAAVPTMPPTVATTVPLPTQVTSLAPVSAPPTTAGSINDSAATRLVNRVILALVGLALLVALLTFWYWRSTKPVPASLDGLDLMSSRKWLRAKWPKRERLLGEFRAKRGPVPEEQIARTGGQSVRVGAAVKAPEPAPAGAESLAALAGATVAAAAGPVREPAGPPAADPMLPGSSPSPAGPAAAEAPDAGPVPDAVAAAPEPVVAPDGPETANGDSDSAFTVVARRPRGQADDRAGR